MSKTFKSIVSNREVRIWPTSEGFAVSVLDDVSNECTSTQLAPADAPALALAVVNSAYPPAEYVLDGSPEAFLAVAREYLRKASRAIESKAKEAADQKQLEEEAWQLLVAVKGTGIRKSWGEVSLLAKSEWISAARKAREMHGGTK